MDAIGSPCVQFGQYQLISNSHIRPMDPARCHFMVKEIRSYLVITLEVMLGYFVKMYFLFGLNFGLNELS